MSSDILAKEKFIKTMKNRSNTVPQKDDSSQAELNTMKYCNLPDRVFKIAVMKISKLQKKIRKAKFCSRIKINEKKEYFTKEIETLKRTKQKFCS